ncbi:MAG TPA: PDZ domain-containing protein [Sphingobium sp.]|nr:PDZ domain-containing protein [Sphingobium sp.]
MRWPARLFYAIVLLAAATPPLLSSWLARPLPQVPALPDRAGLTLGTRADRQVVVTSVQGGGLADRGGLAVGDTLRAVGGERVTGAVMARHLIDDAHGCATLVDYRRGGRSHMARLRRCREHGDAAGSRNGPQDTARGG